MKTKITIEIESFENEYSKDDIYMGFVNLMDVCPHSWHVISWE